MKLNIGFEAFQFTPLREGRPHPPTRCPAVCYFNSRPSARGDARIGYGADSPADISIHAPPRGATFYRKLNGSSELFQFTPLREGRRCPRRRAYRRRLLFQFTPLREGRLHQQRPFAASSDFNSRPSARGDSMAGGFGGFNFPFQFTPLREGRRPRYSTNFHQQYFNSRPSARGDAVAGLCVAALAGVFQFTPLREGRRYRALLESPGNKFQFTPLREGRRCRRGGWRVRQHISIHAPPRGATRYRAASYSARKISIHAPPRGATYRFRRLEDGEAFQFTPLREGRRLLAGKQREMQLFQFTPLREGRLYGNQQ